MFRKKGSKSNKLDRTSKLRPGTHVIFEMNGEWVHGTVKTVSTVETLEDDGWLGSYVTTDVTYHVVLLDKSPQGLLTSRSNIFLPEEWKEYMKDSVDAQIELINKKINKKENN